MSLPPPEQDTHIWELKNFSMAEVACTCPHCLRIDPKGLSFMSWRTMIMIQKSRDHLGGPIYFNSGCRCWFHNKIVGGISNSSHLFTIGEPGERRLTTAGDVTVVNPRERRVMTSSEQYALRQSLSEGGFTRFGRSQWFIHIDNDPRKVPKVEWFY